MATITFKCPNCGGGLVFDPSVQKFRCEFCNSVFTQNELDALSPDQTTDRKDTFDYEETPEENSPQSAAGKQQDSVRPGKETDRPAGLGGEEAGTSGPSFHHGSGEAVIYTCPSCGAEIVTDAVTAATFCYYCHNPVVLQGKLSGDYLPDKIIPFKYNRDRAEEEFIKFVRSKKFVPAAFFSREQIEKLTGVYYPFWVYDCELSGYANGRMDRIRVWMSGDDAYTETSIYHFERGGTVRVEGQVSQALKQNDHRLIDAVMPYNMRDVEDFSMGFLQGFVAQRRDVETKEISKALTDKARSYALTAMRNTVTGYQTVSVENSHYDIRNERWQYLLLPVWVLTYGRGSTKKYYFAMNGDTGEVQGRLPVSGGRLAAFSAILGAAAFAVSILIGYFLI